MHTHKLEQSLPGAQPAYLANGLIGLRVPPIPLPQGWDAFKVERLWAHGKPWRLTARHGAGKASLESLA